MGFVRCGHNRMQNSSDGSGELPFKDGARGQMMGRIQSASLCSKRSSSLRESPLGQSANMVGTAHGLPAVRSPSSDKRVLVVTKSVFMPFPRHVQLVRFWAGMATLTCAPMPEMRNIFFDAVFSSIVRGLRFCVPAVYLGRADSRVSWFLWVRGISNLCVFTFARGSTPTPGTNSLCLLNDREN